MCELGAILLILSFTEKNFKHQENIWLTYSQQVAPPIPQPYHINWNGVMCSEIVTGTYGMTWIITGTRDNLSKIGEYHIATFDQSILERSDTRIKVQVTSKAAINSTENFPLDSTHLPSEVSPFLKATSEIQSKNPTIVQQAQELVNNTQTEAQAVIGILDWVRAKIIYDYTFSLPNDAVSVYNNRSGVCAGFSNLAVALLRAVGIPSRVQEGCALWALPSGGGHAWIEIYYPDVGWVPSEPQGWENFVYGNQVVSSNWWDWCGKSSTIVSSTNITEGQILQIPRTPYSDTIWMQVSSANVPAWDRNPLKVIPVSVNLMLPVENPIGDFSLQINNLNCYGEYWQVTTQASWLSPKNIEGFEKTGTALFTINATGMYTGFYTSPMTIRGSQATPRTIPVNMWLVDSVYSTYLPYVAKGIQ